MSTIISEATSTNGKPEVSINPRRLVVLVSGTGSNLQALISALNTPSLPDTSIVLVVSNRRASLGLLKAQNAIPPIPTAYLSLQTYLKEKGCMNDEEAKRKGRLQYDKEVGRIVKKANPDVVVLAGWMHVFGEGFLNLMQGEDADADGVADVLEHSGHPSEPSAVNNHQCKKKVIPVINIHPALPGAFDGTRAIERAYEAFQRGEIARSGVMVHRVVKEVDRGQPVLVKEVEMIVGEPLEQFEERMHMIEWEVIVEATKIVLDEVRPAS